MTRRLELRPAAADDISAAHAWYEAEQAGLGAEFTAALDAVLGRIVALPELYAADRRDVRQAPVNRFPYAVYYRILGDTVEVFAVVHTSRHPRAWRSRL